MVCFILMVIYSIIVMWVFFFFGQPLKRESEIMASTFAAMSSVGSLAAPSGRVVDKKFQKLSSSSSISSCSFARRQNVVRRTPSPRISAMAKELHFNKDGSAIKKLQVGFLLLTRKNGVLLPLFDFSLSGLVVF